MQLLDTEQLASEVPAHAMQIQNGRRIGPFCRPPPGMDVLIALERRGAQFEFLNTAGQAAVPTGNTRFNAKDQLPFFMLKHRAAHRHADNHGGQRQPLQPAKARSFQ
ncbi:hypothetical protein D3C76_1286370 [compost metagenome]